MLKSVFRMKAQLTSVNIALAIFLAAVLFVTTPALRAQDGAEGALARVNPVASLGRPHNRFVGPKLAIADFDSDDRPDGALLLEPASFLGSGSFQIELHFTGRKNANITFRSPEPDIAVAALDIDHDGDIDIVIEQSLTHKRLQVWLNDGHGNFEKGRIEDFPSVLAPARDRLLSSERSDCPAVSLPTQRGLETMLLAGHIAGRPPSEGEFAAQSTRALRTDPPFSLNAARAPPLS